MNVHQQLLMSYPAAISGDPYWSYVVFLSHFNGVDGSTVFIDQKGNSLTGVGNAKLASSSAKFGTTGLSLDGAGDWVQCNDSTRFSFPGDFCVEAFINTAQAKEQVIVDHYKASTATWQLEMLSSGKVSLYSGSSAVITGATSVNNGVYHHVAVSRQSNTFRLFVDGNLDASAVSSADLSAAATYLGIGAQISTRNSSYDFNGSIDEVRITNGVARYTAAFSIPSSAFPDS